MLTLNEAMRINAKHVTSEQLRLHALAVSCAMGALAERFGEDCDHWAAVGYLHDVDYEKYPTEHLLHTRELLSCEDVDETELRCILSHGYGQLTELEPVSLMERSLFAVDELTGIVMAAALMRPDGIRDFGLSSAKKKFKDKRFAAKCDRALILRGCEMLGMSLDELLEHTIRGMQKKASELGLEGRA